MPITSLDVPGGLFYSPHFMWLRREPERCTFGLCTPLLERKPPIYYVRLPEPGQQVESGEPIGFVEGPDWAVDLLAPATGAIHEVNSALQDDARALWQDPYGEGWLARLGAGEPAGLMSHFQARVYYAQLTSYERGFYMEQLWRPGQPWFDSMVATLGGSPFLTIERLEEPASRVPEWKTGTGWEVQVRKPLPAHWRFRVTSDPGADRIVLSACENELTHWLLELDAQRGTLLEARSPSTGERLVNGAPGEGFIPWPETDPRPFDWPRPIAGPPAGPIPGDGCQPGTRYEQLGDRWQLTMSRTLLGRTVESHIQLDRGAPWWTHAQRIVDGVTVLEAEGILP